MRPPEILTKARELISDPAKWTKDHYARDKAGNSVDSTDEEAVCWCALGAIRKVLGSRTDSSIASGFLAQAMPKGVLIDMFNDDSQTTHEDVLKAFDRAIELAKKEEMIAENEAQYQAAMQPCEGVPYLESPSGDE